MTRLHPGLVYTAARFAVFLGCAAVLYGIGFRRWFLVLGALLISAPLSYFLLRRPREAFARRVAARAAERRAERAHLRTALRGDDAPAA